MNKSIASNHGAGKKQSKYEMNRIFTLNDPTAPRLSPALAKEIGLNESILFLQIEFLIAVNDNVRDGRRWTYQSLSDWKEKYFIFWSESTIDRALKSLEKQGLIFVAEYNQKKYDRTKWYSINFEAAAKLTSINVSGYETQSRQNETPICKTEQVVPEWDTVSQNETGFRQIGTTIPDTTTDITTKNKPDIYTEHLAAPCGDGDISGGNENESLLTAQSDLKNETSARLLEFAKKLGGGVIAVEGRERKAAKEICRWIEEDFCAEQDVYECARWMRDQKMFAGQGGFGGFARSLLSVQKQMSVFLQLRSEGNLNRNKFETREERNERIREERDAGQITNLAAEFQAELESALYIN